MNGTRAHEAPQRLELRIRREQTVRLGAMAALAVLVAAFAFANREQVSVDWVFGHADAPMFLVLIGTAGAGAVLGWLAHWRTHRETGRS